MHCCFTEFRNEWWYMFRFNKVGLCGRATIMRLYSDQGLHTISTPET